MKRLARATGPSAAYDVAASLDPEDPIVRSSLENAVAVAVKHRGDWELASSARTTPAGPPSIIEVDREGDDTPPSLATNWRIIRSQR